MKERRGDRKGEHDERPQVVPISEQLRMILRDARQRTHPHVVEYRRRPIKTIRGGLRNAADSEAIRKGVMGHRNIATAQKYTHLRPMHEMPAHERLADAMPISDLVMVPRKRAAGKGVGKSVGTLADTDGQTQGNTGPSSETHETRTVT